MAALVLNHLDFGNRLYASLYRPAKLVGCSRFRMRSRLVFGLRRSEHITDALVCLHWLRVPERIAFKVAVLTYRALHGQGLSYMSAFTPVLSLAGRRSPTVVYYHRSRRSSDAPVDRRAQGVSCFWRRCVEQSAYSDLTSLSPLALLACHRPRRNKLNADI